MYFDIKIAYLMTLTASISRLEGDEKGVLVPPRSRLWSSAVKPAIYTSQETNKKALLSFF